MAIVLAGSTLGGSVLLATAATQFSDKVENLGSDSQSSQTSKVASKLTTCGADWNCLVQSAKTCTLAQARGVTYFNLGGLWEYTITGLHEIWGKKGNKCVLYSKGEHVQVKFSDAYRRAAQAQGMTPQQITEYERFLSSKTSAEPVSSICRFSQSSDLAKYLQLTTQKENNPLEFRIENYSLNSPSSRSFITLENRDIAECDSHIDNYKNPF